MTARLLARASVTGLLNAGVSAATAVVLLPVLLRTASLENYAVWAALGVFPLLAALLDLGLQRGLVLLVARGSVSPNHALGVALGVGLVAAGACVGALAIALAAGLEPFGPHLTRTDPRAWALLAAGGTVLAAALATNALRAVLEAAYRLDAVNVGYALQTVAVYALAVAAAALGHGPVALLASTALVYLAVLAGHWHVVTHVLAVRPERADRATARRVLHTGLHTYGAELPTLLLMPGLQIAFLHSSASLADYGVFDLVLRISNLAFTGLAAVSGPLLALVASAERSGDRRPLARTVALAAAATAVGGGLGYLVFLAWGTPLMTLFAGEPGPRLAEALTLTLAGVVALATTEPLMRAQNGLGHLGRLFVVRFGILGTAAAALILGGERTLTTFAAAYLAGYLAGAALAVAVSLPEIRRARRPGLRRAVGPPADGAAAVSARGTPTAREPAAGS